MQFAPADCSRLPRLVELDSSLDGMTLQERFEAVAKDNFLGVPIAGFEASDRDTLADDDLGVIADFRTRQGNQAIHK